MKEQIKMLNDKVDKLQATLDRIIERMWPPLSTKNIYGEEIQNAPRNFIGGGITGNLLRPDETKNIFPNGNNN